LKQFGLLDRDGVLNDALVRDGKSSSPMSVAASWFLLMFPMRSIGYDRADFA
jgi:hypothetical protein